MSAAVVILPVVWAFAERSSARRDEKPELGRKGPYSLRLVQASGEEQPEAAPELVNAVEEPAHELAFYRKYTEGMLGRYLTMSMEAGRVPSLLGRELFRGNVSHYKVHSFEDVVVYVNDMEKCLARLDPGRQVLIRKIALQGYTQGEASAMLGITLRTVVRHYANALDQLTAMFMELGMLEPDVVGCDG